MKLDKSLVHLHHISSHFTSAMYPAASILLTIFIVTGARRFEQAAFYCIVFGVLAGPFVYASGVIDWKNRFKARHTRIFDHKLVTGVILLLLSVVIITSRIVFPDIAIAGTTAGWGYLALVYAATAAAAYLGHLGSKFI